jgi:hypothetical protein
MSTRRKGAARGTGRGYKNLRGFPRDPVVHAQAARGMKQPQKLRTTLYGWKDIAPFKKGKALTNLSPVTHIGDGKSPNRYWVTWTNDFMICKKGHCDWASQSKKFKVKGETIKKPFNTYQEAIDYIENNLIVSDVPKEDNINTVQIEDRISGQVYEQGIVAYPKREEGILQNKGWVFEIETHPEINFTKKEMERRGEQFR